MFVHGAGEDGIWHERDYLIFVGNEAEIAADYYDAKFAQVLDYGCCRQLAVYSRVWSGTDRVSNIFGVRGGKAVSLCGGRLTYTKVDFFLNSSGV